MGTRAAVIADTPLKRHFYRNLLAGFGWQVEVYDLAFLQHEVLSNEAVTLWLVDANDSDNLPDALFELPDVLFCDEQVPSPDSVEALRLTRRLKERFAAMGLTVSASRSHTAVTLAIPAAMQAKAPDDIELVVAVAASAGGPRAVAEFFNALPANLPVAFLYGQHIDAPCWQSLPAAVSNSKLEGVLIEADTELHASRVHVLPVEGMLMFEPDWRMKTMDVPWSGPYSPNFNQFLQLFAQQFGAKSVAIIFSGMDNDGVEGAKFIQQVGGKVWAQSSESAEQPSMPDAVSDAGVVDFRGTPSQLANHLVQTIIARRGRT
ncbi:chemotaxis protein CheB [Salinibius halmophilus]|uniref:chemotaxis protein CheB n=1 Tax=Salinibius halmophilus TaxID=1853216 RepID=UPI000E661488|nr:chemotaxis protein CheB [Salinibius halmophilus]